MNNAEPISFKPLSFSSSKSNGQHYRSIPASTSHVHGMHALPHSISTNNISICGPSDAVLKGLSKSHSLSTIDFGLSFTEYPKSKAPVQMQCFPELTPLNLTVCNDVDPDHEDMDMSMSSPSAISPLAMQIPPSLVPQSAAKYCNELNSYLVSNFKNAEIMDILKEKLCSFYHDDIDFKLDREQQKIEGLVFINNVCVSFVIYLWNEQETGTRLEFRRTSGDALAAAKLWSQIKTFFASEDAMDVPQAMDLDFSLDFIASDLEFKQESVENTVDHDLLDEITQSLKDNNVFVVDELNYLYDCLSKHKSLCFKVLSHKALMKELINSCLLHKDICVSRSVLLILSELAVIDGHGMDGDGCKLYENINLLLKHQRVLIKKCTIRLLDGLLSDSTECPSSIDAICKQQIIENVKRCDDECNNDSFHGMIAQINQKLMN